MVLLGCILGSVILGLLACLIWILYDFRRFKKKNNFIEWVRKMGKKVLVFLLLLSFIGWTKAQQEELQNGTEQSKQLQVFGDRKSVV